MRQAFLLLAGKAYRSLAPAFLALGVAFVVSALLLRATGESPIECYRLILKHAFFSSQGWAFILYNATVLTFVGLAVAVPYQAGLFNVGAEGQLYAGCLGCVLVALALDGLPRFLAVPLCLTASAVLGAAAGLLPGWLKARRGVHEVIATILLNVCWIALINFLTTGPMKDPGLSGSEQMIPQTREIPESCVLPSGAQLLPGLVSKSVPLSSATILAIGLCLACHLGLFRTRTGFLMRSLRQGSFQVLLAGGRPALLTILSLGIGGALAGLVASSEVMGARHRLLDNFSGGLGYQGIAVALLARGQPLWVPVSGLFFGALQKGCSVLDVYTHASKEIAWVLQALVILCLVALERPRTTGWFSTWRAPRREEG